MQNAIIAARMAISGRFARAEPSLHDLRVRVGLSTGHRNPSVGGLEVKVQYEGQEERSYNSGCHCRKWCQSDGEGLVDKVNP